MSGFILGQKSESSQHFDSDASRIPVTYIKTAPCFLTDIMTVEKQGYLAARLGYGSKKNIHQPQKKQLEKAGITAPLRFFREFRLDHFGGDIKLVEENSKAGIEVAGVKLFVGQEVKPSQLFKVGEKVTVSGISKGKGFQGVVKRHHFKGGSRTHGQSDRERAPGSIGMTTTPGRIFKGKRMAGRMGNERITIKNLMVISVDDSGLLVKGLIPGGKNGLLEVRSS